MQLNSDQQRAVDIRRNAVVSAGAGSGKTTVLSRRYIRLVVSDHIPVSRTLALTFTRKAAAEMYQRIYEELSEYSHDPFVADQLARFDEAFIGTLDSFCGAIARDGCSAFGVAPGFAIDEQALRRECELLALQFLRSRISEPGLGALVQLTGFRRTWEALADLAREHVPVTREIDFSELLRAQQELLGEHLRETGNRVESALAAILDLDPSAAKCVALAHGVATKALEADPFATPRALPASDPAQAAAAAAAIEPAGRIQLRCGSSKKADVMVLKQVVEQLREDVPLYATALRTVATRPVQENLYEELTEFGTQVRRTKQQNGLLSYHDVLELAIAVLEADLELRGYYKQRYDAIMIDEFQDNNDQQKRLLYLLAEQGDRSVTPAPGADDLDPGKLFFVGDEKQSIYRFRGADVSVFRMLADDFGEDGAISLGSNYRSEPGLIRFFNVFFEAVFADASAPFEARFLPLAYRDPLPGLQPSVHLCRVTRREQGDETHLPDVDAQAFHIASTIRGIVDDETLLVGANGRAAGYSDIAILLKSSGNQIRLERMLRIFGIPYASQSVRSLFLEAPANDIYQALQLVLYPQDRVAYAGFLRSPLVGLSDEAIARILLENPDAGLFPQPAGLSAEDRRRRELARERRDELVGRSGGPITDLLRIIWYEWGYRYHLLRRDDYTVYLEYYDLLWELAFSFEERGLAAFLDEVRGQLGQNAKLDDIDLLPDGEEGVQIMTIHKSKGLEFPVVIAAYTENTGRNNNVSDAAYHWLGDLGPAFNTGFVPDGAVKEKAANFLYSVQAKQNELEEEAERKRLLYVAATRAESHLYFFGTDKDEKGSLNTLILPAFDRAETQLASDAEVVLTRDDLAPVEAGAEREARVSPASRTVASIAERYEALPLIERTIARTEFTATELNTLYAESLALPAELDLLTELRVDPLLDAHDLFAAFGTLCHLCIERAPHAGYSAPPVPAEIPEDQAVGSAIARVLTEAQQELFRVEAATLAANFLTSEFWRQQPASVHAEHEVPFLLQLIEGRPLLARGKIDLILENDDFVQVVDFKSDRHVDPLHYALQLELYRRAAAALFELPVSVALFDLRRGQLMPVDPPNTEEIDEFLRRAEIELTP